MLRLRVLSAVAVDRYILCVLSSVCFNNHRHFFSPAMSEEIMEIDGGSMEGGGQILRMALAFSALLKKPIRIYNIRAGRSSPGLRPQHLAGVKLIGEITKGRLIGAEIGSTEVTFNPGHIIGGSYKADPGTAGSVMLLFQISFPCLLFADKPSELFFQGGTNADMAPQIDDVIMVFKPIVERLGAKFSCDILKRGYFPKGGGKVAIKVEPVTSHLQAVNIMEPGDVMGIEGRSFVAGVLPIKMAHTMADGAAHCLRGKFSGIPIKIERLKEPSHLAIGNGSGIVLVAKTSTGCLLGGSALGKRGTLAEEVGKKAAVEIIESVGSQACVDTHVQDQLVIFMALAKGKSQVRIGVPTLHTKTAIFVAEMMTKVKFKISEEDTGRSCILECEGIGYER